MKRVLLPLLALPLLAASPPPRGFNLTMPGDASPLPVTPPNPPAPAPLPQRYAPAPLPNRDVDAPLGPRASNEPRVAPGLFTRSDQYRGEGFSSGSSAQTEQEKRLRPGAGINLHLPLTGQ